jgi:4-hydroxyphenylacetate 3-monooxygenase
MPMNAPGLRLMSRRGYAAAASSVFDYPLTTQFDETDVLAIFDDVFVPWDKVFIYKNLDLVSKQWTETPAHLLGNNQAQIRFTTKLDFLTGVARKIAEMNQSLSFPPVRTMLGELAAYTSLIHASVYAQEQNCAIDDHGIAWPAKAEEFAVMVWQSDLVPKMLQMVRDLCGGGLIQLPSSVKDFTSPLTRPDVDRFVQSPGHSAEERVKLMKLAWDLIGSEFASRNLQYEMFYVGAPHGVRGRRFAMFDWDRATGLVDNALNSYDLNGLKK